MLRLRGGHGQVIGETCRHERVEGFTHIAWQLDRDLKAEIQRLIEQMEEISDVMVHIDPENDEKGSPGFNLPLRRELEKKLHHAWADIPIAGKIEYITLHYLGGKIHIDLLLPLAVCSDRESANQIRDSLVTASKSVENIGEVSVCFH